MISDSSRASWEVGGEDVDASYQGNQRKRLIYDIAQEEGVQVEVEIRALGLRCSAPVVLEGAFDS